MGTQCRPIRPTGCCTRPTSGGKSGNDLQVNLPDQERITKLKCSWQGIAAFAHALHLPKLTPILVIWAIAYTILCMALPVVPSPRQLYDTMQGFAAGLHQLGVKKHDKVNPPSLTPLPPAHHVVCIAPVNHPSVEYLAIFSSEVDCV